MPNAIIENNIIFYFGKKGYLQTLASCAMNESGKNRLLGSRERKKTKKVQIITDDNC
jgi:hypothetical protein